MTEDIFFLDYGGCHAIAAQAMDLPTSIRRKFVERLLKQLEREDREIAKIKSKGKR